MAKRGKRNISRDEFEEAAASYRQVAEALASLVAMMQKAKVSEMNCEANTLLLNAVDMHVAALRLKSQFEIEQATKKK